MNILGQSMKLCLLTFIGVIIFLLAAGIYSFGLSLRVVNAMAIPAYVCYLALFRGNLAKIIRWYHFAYIGLIALLVSSYMVILAHIVPEIRVRWTEVPFATGFLISIHITLKIIDYGANALFSALLHIKPAGQKFANIVLIKNVLRITCVVLIAVPYLLSVFLVDWVKFADNTSPGQYGMEYQQVQFKSTDGTRLEGWFIKSMRSQPESTVIIAPGYGTTKSCFLSYAMIVSGNGQNVFLFDQRGQGGSHGHMHSFGQLEAKDITGAVNYLKENYSNESKHIFALGVSEGSAAVITAAAEDERIDAVVLDSAIAGSESFTNKVTRWLIWPFNKYIIKTTGIFASALAGCNLLSDTELYSDITKISPRPLLIFHGAADNISDYEQVKRLYAQAGKPKKLCVVPGAGHTESLLYIRNQYIEELTDVFIEGTLTR